VYPTLPTSALLVRSSPPRAAVPGNYIDIYDTTQAVEETIHPPVDEILDHYENYRANLLTGKARKEELDTKFKDNNSPMKQPAFYDTLTKPQAIRDFYMHKELISITGKLTELLWKNRTID